MSYSFQRLSGIYSYSFVLGYITAEWAFYVCSAWIVLLITASAAGTSYISGSTLHLAGEFTYDDIKALTVGSNVKKTSIKYIVADEGAVFPADCRNLFDSFENVVSFDLSKADTSQVTDMSYMFDRCKSLTSLDVSNFNVSNVTTMRGMFAKCVSLKSLKLFSGTGNVTSMAYMFADNRSMEFLDLTSFDTSSVREMQYMFDMLDEETNQESLLETIAVGSKWSMKKITDSTNMFRNCKKLEGARGTKFDADHVTGSYAIIDGTDGKPGYFSEKSYSKCYVSGTTLYLSGRVDTYGYNGFDKLLSKAGMTRNDITKIEAKSGTVFPANSSGLFHDFTNVTTFELSNANTANVTNMSEMFKGCNKVSEINISKWNLSKVTNMNAMFRECYLLTSVKLPTSTASTTYYVTNTAYMFGDCNHLKELDLTYLDTSSVTEMWGMFSGCSSLETINVTYRWNTSSLTSEEAGRDMFSGCTSLVGSKGTKYDNGKTSAAMAHIDGKGGQPGYFSGTTTDVCYVDNLNHLHLVGSFAKTKEDGFNSIESALTGRTKDSIKAIVAEEGAKLPAESIKLFMDFTNVTTINLAKADTSNVTNMNLMFANCSALRSVYLSSFNTSNVTKMTGMFGNCSSLKTLDISSFDTKNVTTMTSMFNGCTNLTTITVSDKWTTSAVAYSENMFDGCTSLRGGKGTTVGSSTNKQYASIDRPGSPGYLTGTEDDVSYVDPDGKTLHLVGEFKKSGTGNSLEAALTKAGKEKTDITKIVAEDGAKFPANSSEMFSGYMYVTEMDLSKADTSNVTDMSRMFYGCNKVLKLDLSNFDTSSVTSMEYMFGGCHVLFRLDIKKFNTSDVTNMKGMFAFCHALENVDLSSFDTSSAEDMSCMFDSCEKLTSLDLSGFDTSNVEHMDYMFNGDTALKTIRVSDKWTTEKLSGIGIDIFTGCTALVGGKGTVFDTSKTDKEYARIDWGTRRPGYLTGEAPAFVESIKLDNTEMTLNIGDEGGIGVIFTPAGATTKELVWTSSNESVAEARNIGDGLCSVIAKGKGTATITVTATNNTEDTSDDLKAACVVTVRQQAEGVSLNKNTLVLYVGVSETLFADVLPINADNKAVTWESDNTAAVSVDTNGKVTAVSLGTAKITVTTNEGAFIDTCTVSVRIVGDLNGDGKVDNDDTAILAGYIMNKTDEAKTEYNIDGNDSIDGRDLIALRKIIGA